MGSENLPLIVIELLLVLGGALAFGYWQLRDLARERAKREAKRSNVEGREVNRRDDTAPDHASEPKG